MLRPTATAPHLDSTELRLRRRRPSRYQNFHRDFARGRMPAALLFEAPVRPNERCDYERLEDSSPALGAYPAMRKGLMAHEEHVLVVARWCMHNAPSQSPAVLERFRPVVQTALGMPQALFPLEA